jgi:hypothetical protein
MSVAMFIAAQRAIRPREFFLWLEDGRLTVERQDGSKASGPVVLLDRGDRVTMASHFVREREWGAYVLRGDAEIDPQGKLRIPAAPHPVYALYPPCMQWATLREHQGEVDLIYFNRVELIQEDWQWPKCFVTGLEDDRYNRLFDEECGHGEYDDVTDASV